ncbi:MAG: hypothetical protein ACRBF0_05150 [Calditrichia bacterium]
MKKLLCLLLIFGSFVFAEGNGGFSGSFLRLGLGARGMAMGNAQVASADYGYGVYYNPGALPLLKDRHFSASWSSMSLDRKFNYVGLALPLKPFGGFSLGWVNSGVNDLRAYNSVGQDVGAVEHGLNAIYASFGLQILRLVQADGKLTNLPPNLINVGISAKFLRESLSDTEDFNYNSNWGFGIDIGVLLKPHESLTIGYQAKDVGADLNSNTNDLFDRGTQQDNKFPITQKVGAFYHTPLRWLSLAYDFEWSNKGEEKNHVGLEVSNKQLAGRVGFDNDHLTLGGGIEVKAYKQLHMVLDYAFVDSVEDEGISHVFSWQFVF